MIEVKGLSYSYFKEKPVLEDLSFTVQKGEVVNILGPNGCGKSTLIRLMLGFLKAKNGSIFIEGENIKSIKRKRLASMLSYVPQHHAGLFDFKALDVVLMGRASMSPWHGYTKADYKIAQEALERIGMGHLAKRSYLQLSGGERQLVLVARSLAQKADYFIMDEPVSGLDYGNQFLLLQTVKDLVNEGLTVILSTHHPEHAIFLGGRALLIKNGKIMADGAPETIITTKCICHLYDMPREYAEKFDIHFARRKGA